MEETQVSSTPTPEVSVEDIRIGLTQAPFKVTFGERKKKGEAVLLPFAILHGFKVDAMVDVIRLATAIGPATFAQCIWREVIKPACLHASAEAFGEVTGEGEDAVAPFNAIKWAKAFVDYFQATTRVSGPKVKDIMEKMVALSTQMGELYTQIISGGDTPERKNRLMQIVAELQQLNLLKDKKSRLGRPKKSEETAPTAQPA